MSKYNLTMSFDTLEEVQSFLATNTATVATVSAAPSTANAPTVDDAAAKKAAANLKRKATIAAKKAAAAAELPPVVSQIPTVDAAAAMPSPAVRDFNREACIANVTNTITKLTAGGVTEQTIANLLTSVFSKLGIAGQKISTLDDSSLINFYRTFEVEIQAFVPQEAPAAPMGSAFI